MDIGALKGRPILSQHRLQGPRYIGPPSASGKGRMMVWCRV